MLNINFKNKLLVFILPSIVIPVVLIISVNFFITSNKISALQYELLRNNVTNILSKSESGYRTISALGMDKVEFYIDATKKGVVQDIGKNLAPGTSISIFDTTLNEVVFSLGEGDLGQGISAEHIQAMVGQQSGQVEYTLQSNSGENIDTMVSFGVYSNWNWIVVSLVNKEQLFKYTNDAMKLSFAVAGVLLFLLFAVIYSLSNRISRAVLALEQGAQKLSTNEQHTDITIEGDNEFSRLASTFNIMAEEIRRTEDQLRLSILEEKRANMALEKSQKQYYDLIEGTPDLICRVDIDGRLLFVNHAANKFFGLRPEDCIGRMAFDFIHPDDKEETKLAFNIWVKGENEILSYENRHVSELGHMHHLEWSIRTEYDENANVTGFASRARDITEYKRNEKERIKLVNQLHQTHKMEAVGELAGGIAHDFNNMLGVILGHAEIALHKPELPSCFVDTLEHIIKASKHSAELTKQLLTFARKQNIEPRVLNVNASLAPTLTMLRRLIGENIQLILDQETNLWLVKVDPTQIIQIITNLCLNARDAISGVGVITIKIRNYLKEEYVSGLQSSVGFLDLPTGEYVHISVSDNGSGMDSEVLEHIFEPFYTTKGLGKGTGLGLSTVLGAVEQNKGFVNVFSEPKRGSTIHVYFPKEYDAIPYAIGSNSEPNQRGTETLLLVEDDTMLLEIETAMLEQNGYKVLQAATVRHAEDLAREYAGRIDLLVTDVIMPEMNGKDLSEKLTDFSPEMKVLFMSGYTADIIASHGVISDNIQFLQKPFTIDALTSKVRAVLDVRP